MGETETWTPAGVPAEIVALAEPDAWTAFLDGYSGNAVLTRVLEVAKAGGCQTIVVEHRYVDRDYRSEHAAFWAQRFQPPSPFGRRLHFFTAELSDDDLHRLPEDCGYLGYSVLRPTNPGRVGRTVLSPPPSVADATLALITETVSVFGRELSITGSPFCEQDGEYIRCAHAAAWICHYSAAARGDIGRKSSAEIASTAPANGSPDRALPSKGLTVAQLQSVFGELGQPALFYGFSLLPDVAGIPTPDAPADAPDTPAGFWDRRCISIICRYLNSGFPVLIGGGGHAFTLVGWRRCPESGEVHFIACDDQVGPYEIIESPFAHRCAPWHSIMVPLPPKVFLTGESAEGRAYLILRALWADSDAERSKALLDGGLRLRSRLKRVQDWKRDVAEQTSSDEVLKAVRLTQLPHYVWVVEAHETDLCHQGNCVRATVVFDATSSAGDPRFSVISVPGFVAVWQPDVAEPTVLNGSFSAWKSMLPVH